MASVLIDVNIDIHRIQGLVMEYVDVAVIGGGQSGPAAAHALLRRGLQPVVLEIALDAAGRPRQRDGA
jgi:putative flavoprotein involved in K+ transport